MFIRFCQILLDFMNMCTYINIYPPKNATTKSVEALENPPGSKNIHWRTVNLEATETLDANAGERDERGRGRSPIGNSAVQGGPC